MNDEAMFEMLAPASEAAFEFEFESGKAKKKPAPTVVLPTLTIRDRPFVVLDRFAFDGPAVPAAHDAIIDRIARLIVASRVSGDPIRTVRLVGHTDPTGKDNYNLGLAERRAKAVEAKLRAALAALGPVPAGALSIVPQTLGETRPKVSNATADGRAMNRRVEVFLGTGCNAFFAQYDLRFLPGDPKFGIPAYPNLNAAQKAQRSADVGALVPELLARRNLRASEALAGRVPPAKALPPGALRNSALRLSAGQLALFREYFEDGRGGIEFGAFQTCFERFANGQLRSPIAADRSAGVGEPNGDFFFLFAEFAFLCIDSRIEPALWTRALRTFVKAQEIFMHVYRPAPVSPAPAVGAAQPACPRDPQGKPRARRRLDSFRNGNFKATGASPTVGVGQSSPTRRRALAAKYAAKDLAALRREAQANLQRAQCMP
ncbi:OmpA family protein [Variovorax sp. J2P1-59]|uniref:OmpA family protein n=1 Tax=Variovorax flavidus TaxID=3053501 RepID=UPI0025783174|nr:OmpA family protein [Variovorax sp. J2P1-59]MDM0075109.1 OmpA family protein [Variovorax sp. J2P1-59]